ncbi:hypothetical protein GCM10011571_17510 [Marinithermofilum abyssi]|uniref:Uncharacterized protein n=1 Tax=Marinithermofilum abyssi TaxID=1571185 RepID=A0A8J2VBX9_9BACL|nr:hypothetical protein [Marinithermofilum abyssi]GGE16333.1 hypothetical protein GCM10011571_17510 [Marinithermofilum abyssi]
MGTLTLVNHEKEVTLYHLYKHKATVKTNETVNPDDLDSVYEVAYKAAVQSGFHPCGYDLLNPQVKTIDKNVHEVIWISAVHCD